MDPRPVLFIADLHLTDTRPQALAAFQRFLAGPARDAQALYILGDLFEYWVHGRDAATGTILEGLAATVQAGTPVAFMHGNRDFLFGARDAARAGVRLLADPTIVTLFDRPVLLAHGDAYCTDDVHYQRFRRTVRAPWFGPAFALLPAALRHAIAQRTRARSEVDKRSKPADIMDVNATAIEDAMRRSGCALMIHGHTHRPARHEHTIDGRTCVRWVLADWYGSGSYLRMDRAGILSIQVP